MASEIPERELQQPVLASKRSFGFFHQSPVPGGLRGDGVAMERHQDEDPWNTCILFYLAFHLFCKSNTISGSSRLSRLRLHWHQAEVTNEKKTEKRFMINAKTPSHPPHPRMSHVLKPLLQAKLLLTRKLSTFLTLQSKTLKGSFCCVSICVHEPAGLPMCMDTSTAPATAAHLAVGVGS